jgi:hypothetical protein
MTGFSAAYTKLQNACAQAAVQAQSAEAASDLPPLLQSPASASTPAPLRPNPVAIGASRIAVDATIGAPTETVGTTALYNYMSSAGQDKVMAGYFDASGHLQRFARYVLKDGKVFDEMSQTELTEGQELLPVRHLLATSNSRTGLGPSLAFPGPSLALPGWTR